MGYRVHKWCSHCPCLWTYDAMIENKDDTMEEVVEKAKLPEKCSKCEGDLADFSKVIEETIKCPHCKEDMEMSTWFSNEITEEN